jgi:chaperonin GroEL
LLGQCKKFVTDAKTTTIVGTGSTKAAVGAHVEELKAQLQDVTLGEEERSKLRSRIARLAAGVAVIRVGGATETEMIERKYRIEDALNATRAAADEGIVPGGGMAFFNAVSQVRADIEADRDVSDSSTPGVASLDPEERAGADIVFKACLAPLGRIARNAGQTPEVIVAELRSNRKKAHGLSAGDVAREHNFGYNAATGEHCDLFAAGVIDPVKVTRTALKNAASVAVTFLTLDAVVYDDPSDEEAK